MLFTIIVNRECNINAILDYKKNIEFMNVFISAGVIDRYDILEAAWNVASNFIPEIAEGTINNEFEIIIWKYIPLKKVLHELELDEEEIIMPEGNHSKDKVYLKLCYKPKILKCLSLHFADYF